MGRKRSQRVTEEDLDLLIMHGRDTLIIREEDLDFVRSISREPSAPLTEEDSEHQVFKRLREEKKLDDSIEALAEDIEIKIILNALGKDVRDQAPAIKRIASALSDNEQDDYSDESDNPTMPRPLSGVKKTLISSEEDEEVSASSEEEVSLAYSDDFSGTGSISYLSFAAGANFLGAPPANYANWILGLES